MMQKTRYISVFSGIEAASVAWGGLGWEPLAFSEIDPFPSAVLEKRFPQVDNLGDITKVSWRDYRGAADVLVGGSPCQSFSVAGGRAGLEGESGLMLEYVRSVEELMPTWFLWENVRGALSSAGGSDFRCLLRALDECGYGMAWRVLDARYFGVPQRRRRVFLLGYQGKINPPCEVLFDEKSMQVHPEKQEKDWLQAISNARKKPDESVVIIGDMQTSGTTLIDHVPSMMTSHPPIIAEEEGLRKLTPLECERAQGFPDGWTDVPYRGSEHPADGLRYKALGNSMPVPVMRWIGERMDRYNRGLENEI